MHRNTKVNLMSLELGLMTKLTFVSYYSTEMLDRKRQKKICQRFICLLRHFINAHPFVKYAMPVFCHSACLYYIFISCFSFLYHFNPLLSCVIVKSFESISRKVFHMLLFLAFSHIDAFAIYIVFENHVCMRLQILF